MTAIPLQIGSVFGQIPHAVFDVIHLVLLLIAAYFGYVAYTEGGERARYFSYAFFLFVIAEISYIGYHVQITHFLFSHTISEVLNIVAFALVFLGLREADVLPG